MSEGEIKTIVGTCEEISERNGWTTFSIDVGSQYPVKVSSKVAEVIEAARGVGQNQMAWTFKETEGKENPNRPGTNYKNRWLNKVAPADSVEEGAHAAPSAAGGTAPTSHYDPIAQADKDRTITRMACLKAASPILTTARDSDAERVLAWLSAARAAEAHVYREIDESSVVDDDIPFE